MNRMTIPGNGTIKKLARQMFKGHWLEAFLVSAIVVLLLNVPASLVMMFAPESTILAVLMDVYTVLMQGPLQMGLCWYFISTFRNKSAGFSSLIYGFEYFTKGACLFCVISLKVILWSMLFVVPGIFAIIRYSQAFYILADDPRKGVNQCIEESKMMMKNLKGRYLLFCLGYLGWLILASVPYSLITYKLTALDIFASYSYDSIATAIYSVQGNPMYIISDIAKILFDVYWGMGAVCFYDIVSGNLVFGNPQEPEPCEEAFEDSI